jgi:hypothetical protein
MAQIDFFILRNPCSCQHIDEVTLIKILKISMGLENTQFFDGGPY